MQLGRELVKKILFSLNKNSFSRAIYQKEISRRASLPLTAIHDLAKDINAFAPYTYELHPSNAFYGNEAALKKYLDLSPKYQFKLSIEHGIVLTDEMSEIDIIGPFQTIFSMGTKRLKFLKKYKSNPVAIGPYIYYAQSLLSKSQVKKEQQRLGKNLLVFPAHSLPGLNNEFDSEGFCKDINKLKKTFDSVRICLYWKDILKGMDKVYLEKGFECVTAGHVYDPNFLPRLKAIIETSTVTCSNDIGTQLGYSVLLGKPHVIIYNKAKYSGEKEQVELMNNLYFSKTYQLFRDTFSKNSAVISKTQLKLVKDYWGLDQLKTKKELLKIVKQAEEIFQKNGKNNS